MEQMIGAESMWCHCRSFFSLQGLMRHTSISALLVYIAIFAFDRVGQVLPHTYLAAFQYALLQQ